MPAPTVYLEGRDHSGSAAPKPITTASPISVLRRRERADDLRVVAPLQDRMYAINTLAELRVRRQSGRLAGLCLYRSARLPSRPHRPLQRHPATDNRPPVIRVPAGKQVSVQIQDHRPKAHLSEDAHRVSPCGTYLTTISILPAAASLGYYSIEVNRRYFMQRSLRCGGIQEARIRSPRHSRQAARAARRNHPGHHRCPLLLRRAGQRRQSAVRRLSRPLLVPALVRPRRRIDDVHRADRSDDDYGDQISTGRRRARCRWQTHHQRSRRRFPTTMPTTSIASKPGSPMRATAKSWAKAGSSPLTAASSSMSMPDRYFYRARRAR